MTDPTTTPTPAQAITSNSVIQGTLGHLIAAGLATYGGTLLAAAMGTPWGMIAVPAVLAVTKCVDLTLTKLGKPVPWWLAWIH